MKNIQWIIDLIKAFLDALGKQQSVPAQEQVPTPANTTPTTNPSPDALDLSTVKWLGTPVAASTPITAQIDSSYISGDNIFTKYRPYNWPSNGEPEKPCDAICHLFYELPVGITGGKFDWWTNGGQSSKTLKNVIHEGYYGHVMPTKGTPCWTMISSIDGKQRSNTVKVEWK